MFSVLYSVKQGLSHTTIRENYIQYCQLQVIQQNHGLRLEVHVFRFLLTIHMEMNPLKPMSICMHICAKMENADDAQFLHTLSNHHGYFDHIQTLNTPNLSPINKKKVAGLVSLLQICEVNLKNKIFWGLDFKKVKEIDLISFLSLDFGLCIHDPDSSWLAM